MISNINSPIIHMTLNMDFYINPANIFLYKCLVLRYIKSLFECGVNV